MANEQFVMCARAVDSKKGRFTAEPGHSTYLVVPGNEPVPKPEHSVPREVWVKKLRKACVWGKDVRDPTMDRGDILVFIHGYNNNQEIVMKRHRRLKNDLHDAGWKGEVMSFDWPSDDKALNYLEDRHDAKRTAMHLVTDGICVLSDKQSPDCTINIHMLCHSTGAYVIREAFDDADDSKLPNDGWAVSQVVFIGGDISAASLSVGESATDSLYRHCVRLTNYSNLYDSVLKLSNAKRLGMSSRVGRVGLPVDAPSKAVNVDCSDYFAQLNGNQDIQRDDQKEKLGSFDHSWHIGNRIFAMDLFETLRGDLDRSVIPTRDASGGTLKLLRSA